jgi:hypothetical protein
LETGILIKLQRTIRSMASIGLAIAASSAIADPVFPTMLSENTTGFRDSLFIGKPDGTRSNATTKWIGIGNASVTYDFGKLVILNEDGPDFIVYEVNFGAVEFGSATFSVSADGVHFYDVSHTAAAAIHVPGDEAHHQPAYARAYDLEALTFARYVRIEGVDSVGGPGGPHGYNGFDLDAMVALHTGPAILSVPKAIETPEEIQLSFTHSIPEEFVADFRFERSSYSVEHLSRISLYPYGAEFFVNAAGSAVAIDDLTFRFNLGTTARPTHWQIDWPFADSQPKKLLGKRDTGYLSQATKKNLPKAPDTLIYSKGNKDLITFVDGQLNFIKPASGEVQPDLVFRLDDLLASSFTAEVTVILKESYPNDFTFGLRALGLNTATEDSLSCALNADNITMPYDYVADKYFFVGALDLRQTNVDSTPVYDPKYDKYDDYPVTLKAFRFPIGSASDFLKVRIRMEWDGPTQTMRCLAQNDWDQIPVVDKFHVQSGDYTCPSGKTLMTTANARASHGLICGDFPNGKSARLAAGGAFHKIAGACSVTERQIAPTQFSLCKLPAPRLDDVTLKYDAKNSKFNLMVHGANLDNDALAYVIGHEDYELSPIGRFVTPTHVQRINYQASMYAKKPGTLGYPIYSLETLTVPVSAKCISDCPRRYTVRVENPDGQMSEPKAIELPRLKRPSLEVYKKTLDSDGDGLLDDWEINGYDADGDGIIDVHLYLMGADPMRKDLFVEVDWMAGSEPLEAIWPLAKDMFRHAPVLNPDGSMGINLHVDYGQKDFLKTANGRIFKGDGGSVLTAGEAIHFDSDETGNRVSFHKIKSRHFDKNRTNLFRYGVFAYDDASKPGGSGRAEGIWANDFYASVGSWMTSSKDLKKQLGTFLHELGHTLNLGHGGSEHLNNKPNYNSIMKYGSHRYCANPAFRVTNYGYATAYDALNSTIKAVPRTGGQLRGVDTDCDPSTLNNVYNFSSGMRANLDEQDLREGLGLCDLKPVDWNWDCKTDTTDIARVKDINPRSLKRGLPDPKSKITEIWSYHSNSENAGLSVLRDSPDWARIELDFKHENSKWGKN